MQYYEPNNDHEILPVWKAYPKLFQFKLGAAKKLKGYFVEVKRVRKIEQTYLDLSKVEFQSKSLYFKALSHKNKLFSNRESLLQAVAWLSINAKNELGMQPYDVQLVCALAMIDGHLVQLAPGEGKTLTIGLVAAIFAWSGKPCHSITANDYLAQRDAQLIEPFYTAANLRVSYVLQEMDQQEKKIAYQADIVYGTAKQFLADYLHDVLLFGGSIKKESLALSKLKGQSSDFLMRGLYYAIVDEADSILIDDATTPLIISSSEENTLLKDATLKAKTLCDQLEKGKDYSMSFEDWEINFSEKGEEKIYEQIHQFPRLWHHLERFEDLIKQAILAKDKFELDVHYVIEDGKVVLVDEATGRMMYGRSWSYGMHQAVEARAGVELTAPSKTLEKMSFQSFFQSFHKLTGASGTLQNIQLELLATYHCFTLEVPTRLPTKRRVYRYKVFKTQQDKEAFLVSLLNQKRQDSRPILIGVRRVSDSERLAQSLQGSGVQLEVLNAKFHQKEAEIIAQAGEKNRITIATNMAGRGTDIKIEEDILKSGGLLVVMLEPHEATRIDWQLFGRAGRQGQAGEVLPLVSLEDDLLKRHLTWWLKPLKWIIATTGWFYQSIPWLIKSAQKSSQLKSFKQRKELLKIAQKSQERMSFVKNKT